MRRWVAVVSTPSDQWSVPVWAEEDAHAARTIAVIAQCGSVPLEEGDQFRLDLYETETSSA